MSIWSRLVLALASLSGVAIVAAIIAAVGNSQGRPPELPLWYALFHTFFFVALFGWPLALALMFVLGTPLLELLRKKIRPHNVGGVFAGISSLVGGFLVAAVWAGFWSDSDPSLLFVVIGMVAGAVAGLVFVRIAAPDLSRGATG
jgi:hypothetical protein